MNASQPLAREAAEPRRAAGTRDRILGAAGEMFYAHGIGATSADRIIAQVGITKVTFYRHFRTKADLVVAYLQQQAEGEEAAFTQARESGDATAAMRAIAAAIGAAVCRPGYRGCPFINAAAEFPDPEHPVRIVIDQHRHWMLDLFADIANDAGSPHVEGLADRLMMLRDGAMLSGYLGESAALGDTLRHAFGAVLHITELEAS